MAKEALELHLYSLEEDGDIIPSPTPPEGIAVPEGVFVTLVEAWMPLIRDVETREDGEGTVSHRPPRIY